MRAASRPATSRSIPAGHSGTRCRVESFRESQLSLLFEIESRSFGVDSYRDEFFRQLCLDNREYLLVARAGERLLGYVMAENNGAAVEIISLAVHPDYRGLGLGKKLMQRLLARLRRMGTSRALLMVRADNPVAQNLYRRLGFRRVRRTECYYADGQDAIRMRLDLA